MATRTEPIDFLAGGVALAIGVLISGATEGSLLFVGANADLTEDNANLFWDDGNNRLGLLTAAPSDTLHVGAGGTVRIEDITEGSVLFAAANGVLSQDNVGLFFDPVNNRLGIGTITPGQHITVQESNTSFAANLLLNHSATSGPGSAQIAISVNSGSTGDPLVQFLIAGGQSWLMGVDNSAGDRFSIATGAVLGTTDRLVITSTGLVGIGAGPTTILDVTQAAISILFRMFNSTAASTSNLVAYTNLVNSTTTQRVAAQLIMSLNDITDATHTGQLEFRIPDGGSLSGRVIFRGSDVGIGQLTPARRLHLEQDDGSVGSVTQLLRLTHTTTGTPVAGIGVGMEFEVETAAGNNEIGAIIEAVTTDVGAGTEDFDLVFRTMAAGAVAAERMRITSTGSLDFLSSGSILNVAVAGNEWTADTLTHSSAVVGLPKFILLTNTDGTNTASDATLRLTTASGGGDPQVDFLASGAVRMTMGIDTSASRFAWAENDILGVADRMRLTVGNGTLSVDGVGDGTGLPTLFDEYDDAVELRTFQLANVPLSMITKEQQLQNQRRLVEIGVAEWAIQSDGSYHWMIRVQPLLRLLAGGVVQNQVRMDSYFDVIDSRLRAIGA